MSAKHALEAADEPNATLVCKLVSKSGYRATAEFADVSANQWGRVNAVCGNPKKDRMFASVDLMLDALVDARLSIRCASGRDENATDDKASSEAMSFGGSALAATYDRICDVIAKATGA